MTRMQSGHLLLLVQWFEGWGLRSRGLRSLIHLLLAFSSWSRDGCSNASHHVRVPGRRVDEGGKITKWHTSPQIRFLQRTSPDNGIMSHCLLLYKGGWGRAFRGAHFCCRQHRGPRIEEERQDGCWKAAGHLPQPGQKRHRPGLFPNSVSLRPIAAPRCADECDLMIRVKI